MQQDLGSILAYALYFIVLFAIGLYHMKDTGDMQSYMLGGRKIGPWVSAMSAEASDMSGWACARYMAELAFCCAATAYLHKNRQRFHYAAGLF